MQRGIVIDIEAKHWVVMTADGVFLKIPQQGYEVITGQEVAFAATQIQHPRHWPKYASGAVAAVLALFFLFSSFWEQQAFAQTYLYVEIHPGVEIRLNQRLEVVQMRAIDKEASALLDGLEWNEEPVQQVVLNYLTRAKERGYLKKKDELILSAINKQGSSRTTLHKIETNIVQDPRIGKKQLDLDIFTFSMPQEVKQRADTTGLTPGKYGVWLLNKRDGKEIPLEKMLHTPISQLADDVETLQDLPSETEWKELVNITDPNSQTPAAETDQPQIKPVDKSDPNKPKDPTTTEPKPDVQNPPADTDVPGDQSPATENPKTDEEKTPPPPSDTENKTGETSGSTGSNDDPKNQLSP